jgi:hypothetical protein
MRAFSLDTRCSSSMQHRTACQIRQQQLHLPLIVQHRQCRHSSSSSSSSRQVSCRALESYMVDKLRAAEGTFKELQLRMADPEVANNSQEFQKVSITCSSAHMA